MSKPVHTVKKRKKKQGCIIAKTNIAPRRYHISTVPPTEAEQIKPRLRTEIKLNEKIEFLENVIRQREAYLNNTLAEVRNSVARATGQVYTQDTLLKQAVSHLGREIKLLKSRNKEEDSFFYVLFDGVFKSFVNLKKQQGLMPISVFLANNTEKGRIVHEPVLEALLLFLLVNDIEIILAGPSEYASFTKKLIGKVSAVFQKKEVKKAVEFGVDLVTKKTIEKAQSEIDHNKVQSAAELIKSLEKTDNAVIAIGSIITIKKTEDKSSSIMSFDLTNDQLKKINGDPEMLKSPDRILHMIADDKRKHLIEKQAEPDMPSLQA